VRQVPPLRALPEQRDLGVALDHHLILDDVRDVHELAEAGPSIAEDPGVAVRVGTEWLAHGERVEQVAERLHRVTLARVLVVVGDLLHRAVRLRVLDLEARDEHPAVPVLREHEGNRTLGRDELEARVVEDVVRVEQHRAGEPALVEPLGEVLAARREFLLRDPHDSEETKRRRPAPA
jgi:hypothetical protein